MDELLVQDFHFISCELISQLVVRDDRMLCCISIDVIAVLDQSCFQKSTCLTDIYVPPDHPEMSNIYIINNLANYSFRSSSFDKELVDAFKHIDTHKEV